MQQLHNRAVFQPVDVSKLTATEKKKALESLIFLTEKRDGTIKGRTCANGSVQRNWVDKEDAASPTASSESIFLTSVIEATEEREVAIVDIPNAFVQTEIKTKPGEDKIIMKIRGSLVDMLVNLDPDLYGKYVVFENGKKVLYVIV